MGKALEAEVTLYAQAELADKLAKLGDELRFVLITSGAAISTDAAPSEAVATELEGLSVTVAQSAGTKCDRCWHFTDDVGAVEAHPELCGRCVTNVDGDGEQRQFA